MRLLLVLLVAVMSSSAFAADGGPFGLGLILGEPTALNFKYDANETTGYDAGLNFNLDKWVLLYGDYQHKFVGAFSRQRGLSEVTPYVGVGVVIVSSNRSLDDTRHYVYFSDSSSSRVAIGVRVPFGLEWRPSNTPIGVFGELAPGIAIIPGTVAFLEGGLGIRFYF